jgi:hypothetical protein
MQYDIIGRGVSLVLGVVSAACALGILLEEVVIGAAPFALKHALIIGIVAIAILAGHSVTAAFRARSIFGVLGFTVVFLSATGLVVYKSTGRQAEHTFQSQAEADLAAEARTASRAALARSEAMLADAQRDLARECKSGRGKRCQGIEATIGVYEAAIKGHRADLDRLGPPKPVAPEAENFAALAAVFGADKAKVKAGSVLVVPFLQTCLFEFGAIVGLFFAFRHRPTVRQPIRPSDETPDVSDAIGQTAIQEAQATNVLAFIRPTESNDDDPTTPTKRPRTWKRDEVIADLVGRLERREQFPSQRTLAAFYGVPTSTLSDWLRDAESDGVLHRVKEGRRKAVAAG